MNPADALTIAERIWARDESLWGGPGQPEIGNRLGWLDIAQRMLSELPSLEDWASETHAAGLTNTVLLGMGGSSLGPEVLSRSFGGQLTMLDSTDPGAVLAAVSEHDLARTIFVVSSKSGSTIETLSHLEHFYELSGGNGAQFCAVTDPGSALESLANERGFRKVWLADPNIGGRYSVLSFFGLVPAALAGVPLAALLSSAVDSAKACQKEVGNPGQLLGEKIGQLALAGRDKLTFLIDPPIDSFGLWAEQLIAESTGKHGRGVLPIAGEPAAALDRIGEYGNDRVFVHISSPTGGETENAALAGALEVAGQPVFRIDSSGPEDLGRLMFLFEFAVAACGHVLEINPFDQPNVQESKDATRRVLDRASSELTFDDPAALGQLLTGSEPPTYVALLGYLAPDPAFEAAVVELQRVIRQKTGVATTFGYGPRYLHSTGQLHKGGPPTGRFIQFVHDGPVDLPIPGQSFSFRELKHAQAIGDGQALEANGRMAIRLKLEGDPALALEQLTAALV